MKIPTKILVNRATVEPYLGAGATGPRFGTPLRDVKCRLDSNEQVTVQGSGGTQVVARATMYVRPQDRMANQSRVMIDGQRYEALDVEPINGPLRVAGYKVALG